MKKILENLINKKYYEKEEIQHKVDVFYSRDRISEEDYTYLMDLIEEVYPVIKFEPAEDKIEDVAENNVDESNK